MDTQACSRTCVLRASNIPARGMFSQKDKSMNLLTAPAWITYLSFAVSGIILVIGIYFFGWLRIAQTNNKILADTNALLSAQNDALKISNDELRCQLSEHEKKFVDMMHMNSMALADLQGQVKTLQQVPLSQIAASMEKLSCLTEKMLSLQQQQIKTLATHTQTAERNLELVRKEKAETARLLAEHTAQAEASRMMVADTLAAK
jgi:hypothetical protein